MADFDDDDDFGPWVTPANLTVADAGHKLCELCSGTGVGMDVSAGPDGPIYSDVYCDECGGDGQIKLEEAP